MTTVCFGGLREWLGVCVHSQEVEWWFCSIQTWVLQELPSWPQVSLSLPSGPSEPNQTS